jgi:hypothetical protein
MKNLNKILGHSLLLVAFVTGSVAYWIALGLLTLFIWTIALVYAIVYRIIQAIAAFFQVLFAPAGKGTKAFKSSFWS